MGPVCGEAKNRTPAEACSDTPNAAHKAGNNSRCCEAVRKATVQRVDFSSRRQADEQVDIRQIGEQYQNQQLWQKTSAIRYEFVSPARLYEKEGPEPDKAVCYW